MLTRYERMREAVQTYARLAGIFEPLPHIERGELTPQQAQTSAQRMADLVV